MGEKTPSIEDKIKETEKRFNDANQQKQTLIQNLEKINQELSELQGAHKVLTEIKEKK